MSLNFVLQFLLWINSITVSGNYNVNDIKQMRDANIQAAEAAYNDQPTRLMLETTYNEDAIRVPVTDTDDY